MIAGTLCGVVAAVFCCYFAATVSATAANANATAVAVFDTAVTAVVVVRSLFVAIVSYLRAAHPPCL